MLIVLDPELMDINLNDGPWGPSLLSDYQRMDRLYGAGSALAYAKWCDDQSAEISDLRSGRGQ